MKIKIALGMLMWLSATSLAPAAVVTQQGVVQGTTVANVETFLGVPFATPPLQNLRWRPPLPPNAYPGGHLQATSFPPPCFQGGTATAIAPAPSEDCLYLNVWRPAGTQAGARLPVLVYIYGGGFSGGDGSAFDGTPLVTTRNMLFVDFNYRVGALGWMALPNLDDESPDGASSGNYGFLDQVQMLRWLKQNIEAFGGDRDNITIAGDSAGGISVCMHLAAPLGEEHLFDKAIIESGECQPSSPFVITHQQALTGGVKLAVAAGCQDPANFASCLRSTPASTLLTASAGGGVSDANVGGALVPVHPFAAMAAGNIARVPVIVGANHDEQKSAAVKTTGFPGSVAGYQTYLSATYGTLAPLVAAEYTTANFTDPSYAAGAATTDSGGTSGIGFCPMLFSLGDALARHTTTFAYELNDPNAGALSAVPPGFMVGSEHASENKFLYNGYPLVLMPPGIRPDEQAMATSMRRYWATFAATGQPNDGTRPWPVYKPGAEKVLLFQPGGNVVQPKASVYSEHHCGFWDGLGFTAQFRSEDENDSSQQ